MYETVKMKRKLNAPYVTNSEKVRAKNVLILRTNRTQIQSRNVVDFLDAQAASSVQCDCDLHLEIF